MPIGVLLINSNNEIENAILDAFETRKELHLFKSSDDFDQIQLIIARRQPKVLLITDEITSSPLELICRIMEFKPIPCLLLNTGKNHDSDSNFEYALQYGIVDNLEVEIYQKRFKHPQAIPIRVNILSKLNIDRFKRQIQQVSVQKSKAMKPARPSQGVLAKVFKVTKNSTARRLVKQRKFAANSLVVIAASTGGPGMIVDLISQFPSTFPPIIVVQHMPASFMEAFANRINAFANLNVQVGIEGGEVVEGNVYVAPGGKHLTVEKTSGGRIIMHELDTEKINFVKPSADITLKSVAPIFQDRAIAVILTGMGVDGQQGCGVIKQFSGRVIALNEADSVIFGMNQSVIKAGYADKILGFDQIAHQIAKWVESD